MLQWFKCHHMPRFYIFCVLEVLMKHVFVAKFLEIKQSSSVSGILFPEFILDIPDDGSTSSSHSDETDNVDGISNSEESNKYSAEELEQMAADSAKHEDSLFDEFKKSIKQHPKQVIPEPVFIFAPKMLILSLSWKCGIALTGEYVYVTTRAVRCDGFFGNYYEKFFFWILFVLMAEMLETASRLL